jgi:tetratricopeptide (TPR) repeat protein
MARAALESEVIAKEADKLLRAGHFARALERYEQAATLAPDEADLQAALTWCHYNLSDKSIVAAARAEAALASITTANPKLARAHYFRGLVLKDLGRSGAAIEALKKAHEHDPRLVDAERQARILRIREGGPGASRRGKADAPSRFGLKGLFGKK